MNSKIVLVMLGCQKRFWRTETAVIGGMGFSWRYVIMIRCEDKSTRRLDQSRTSREVVGQTRNQQRWIVFWFRPVVLITTPHSSRT